MAKRQGPIKVNCDECGKEFGTWPFVQKKQKHFYCSRKCQGVWNSKHKKYSKLTPKQKEAFLSGHKKWVQTVAKTAEYRRKLSEVSKRAGCRPPSRKGISPTMETRAKLSLALQGRRKENPISPTASLIRHHFKMFEWRQRVFIRDNFTCQHCGAKSGNGYTVYLEAHHKTPFSTLFKEAARYLPLLSLYDAALAYAPLWDIINGETLCNKCHDKTRKGRATA